MTASKRRLNGMAEGDIKTTPGGRLQAGFRACGILLIGLGLQGCSSVPDAVNPLEWYRGATEMVTGRVSSKEAREAEARRVADRAYPDNREVPERPKVLSPEERKDIAQGLVSDRANAKYTQERINREGTPTRPLAPRPVASEAAKPAAPAAPAAPEPPATTLAPGGQSRSEAPAAQQVAQARAADPSPAAAPEPSAQVAPPPAPARPAATPAPVYEKPATAVDESYRRRLAESATATSMAAAPAAEPAAARPAAVTTRVTHAIIDFAAGKARLTDIDMDDLDELADAAMRSGSRVRVIAGARPASGSVAGLNQALKLAVRRADAVVVQLRRSGVPADRIDVSTDSYGDRVEVGLF